MSDLDPFIELERLKQENKTIKLVNTYKGLPFEHDATIKIVDKDKNEVHIHTTRLQKIAVETSAQTVLESSELPKIIGGDFFAEDYEKDLIIKNLRFLGRTSTYRKSMRLTPGYDFSFVIETPELIAELVVLDITPTAIATRIDDNDIKLVLNEKYPVQISFYLKNKYEGLDLITVDATVYKIHQTSNLDRIVVFEFKLDSYSEQLFKSYMGSRQKEIVREFRKYTF